MSTDSYSIRPDVMEAVQLALGESLGHARQCIEALWDSLPVDDFFHRCVLAHYMADIQADPLAELQWDRLALDAALAASPDSLQNHIPAATWASFLPSLYLNIAASHERIADLDTARHYAEHAVRVLAHVPDTALGELTQSAIERLCERLGISWRGVTGTISR